MQVVITRAKLIEARACLVYLNSPEWDSEQDALVYVDWESSVSRLLTTRLGTTYLGFLVHRGLVPMTQNELDAAISSRKSSEK